MRVYVPFEPDDPKTRLSSVLDRDERERFAAAMLADVYSSVEGTEHEAVVLSTRDLRSDEVPVDDLDVRVSPKPLTPAVNSVLESEDAPVGVVMSDLALATPGSLGRLFSGADDLTLAPGRGGGTNGFVVRTDEAASRFRVDYHGASYLDHVERARDEGLGVSTVDSFRLSTDVDEPDDIVEVLIHGEGESHDYVDGLFELVSDDDENRVTIRRR